VNTYNVTLKYEDRKVGPEGRTIKVDASNIAGAIGKAARDFVMSLWIASNDLMQIRVCTSMPFVSPQTKKGTKKKSPHPPPQP
jgi:hypothetical protein